MLIHISSYDCKDTVLLLLSERLVMNLETRPLLACIWYSLAMSARVGAGQVSS